MLNIALTGNIAAGKSTVAALFRGWGATVIDADQLARETQAPGSPVLEAIVARFGRGVLTPDGALDRATLRHVVLNDADARRALESIVHPAVEVLRQERLALARAAGAAIVVHDIPLLFEVAAQGGSALDPGGFDAVVLVDAPEPERCARLRTTRGLPEIEARQLIAAQLPSAIKRRWRGGAHRRAAYLIENDGDLAALAIRSRIVWDALLKDAPA